jgi:hypothetical protein
VHSGVEMSMNYFACLGGHGAVFIKSELRHVTPKLVFLHPVGSAGHVVILVSPGHET